MISNKKVTPDDNTLILATSFHEVVSIISNGKYVGRLFTNFLVPVPVKVFLIIDRK